MKRGLAILILFLLSGCVDSRLGSGDILTCLDATHVSVTRIPVCAGDESCQAAFEQETESIRAADATTQQALFRMEQGMVSGWANLNDVRKEMQDAREACRSANVLQIFEKGFGGAAALKRGLREYERTMESTRVALGAAAEYGRANGLEYVQDTNAFEAYARILEIGQEWSSGETAHPETEAVQRNKDFFDRMGRTLTGREIGAYDVQWTGMFHVYETVLKKVAPEEASFITMFSPVWQSAMSTYSSASRAREGIELLDEIRMDEIVEHLEEGLAAENGIAFRVREKIRELESGMEQLRREEIETRNRNRERIVQGEEDVQAVMQLREEVEKWMEEVGVWKFGAEFEKAKASEWEEWDELEEQWAEWDRKRIAGERVVGERVHAQRELEKKIGKMEAAVAREQRTMTKWVEVCEEWAGVARGEWIERAQACGRAIETIRADRELGGNGMKESARVRVGFCVDELIRIAAAMGAENERDRVSYYENTFGLDAGVPACEASLLNRRVAYASAPHVIEWESARAEMEKKGRAWKYARAIHPEWVNLEMERGIQSIEEKMGGVEEYVTEEWVADQRAWIEETRAELDAWLAGIVQTQLDSRAWVLQSPEEVRTDEAEVVELVMVWENPFREEIEMDFVFRVPAPVPFSTVREANGRTDVGTVEWGSLGGVWEGDRIPRGIIRWIGQGTQVLATQTERVERVRVNGTHAEMETRLDVNSSVEEIPVRWTWRPNPGIEKTSVRVTDESGRWRENEWKGNTLEGVIDAPGMIRIAYEWPNAIEIRVEAGEEGEDGVVEYRVWVRSALEEAVKTTLFTGITADPVNTRFVEIRGEGGIAQAFTRSMGNAIILSEITLLPGPEREWVVRVGMEKGVEQWRAIGESVVSEAEGLREGRVESIRLRAARVIAEIRSGWNNRTAGEWERLIPGWQGEVEQLSREWEAWNEENIRLRVEWDQLEAEWGPWIREKGDAAVRGWWEAGERARADGRVEPWGHALSEIGKRLSGKNAEKEFVPVTPGVDGNEILLRLKEKNGILRTGVNAYAKAMEPSCEKLDQVGFTCPIGIEEWKRWDALQKEWAKEIEKEMKKEEAKNESEQAQWFAQRANEWEKWEIEMGEGIGLMERGLGSMEGTASELMGELEEKEGLSSEEVKAAVAKARAAMEKGELGKAVFIAQNLRAYWGETSPKGWNGIPLAGWGIIGMLGVGGAWFAHRRWNAKKKEPIIPISIPRVGEESIRLTRPVEPPGDGGDEIPPMRAESQSRRRARASRETRPRQERRANARGRVNSD